MDNRYADYLLGSSDAEHERLIRRPSARSVSERFFREAGLAPDSAFGPWLGRRRRGDAAARLVGPSGEVVAIERMPAQLIARGLARPQAGLDNIRFVETDIAQFSSDSSFDAAVGRFILQFLPDPVGVLRSFAQKVRPGGIIAFQEGSWAALYLLSAHLPLWSAVVSLLHEVASTSGVNTEMGPALYKVFQDAGYPRPACVWKWSWDMIQTSRDGFPILSTASVRKLKSSISRSRGSAISTRYSSGCKRKLHLQTPLYPGSHWWEPGVASP